jgi:hypothetical protein
MKKLILASIMLVASLNCAAYARPQLHTQSIGWIDPTDISCEQTSDHTCSVIKGCGDCSPLAFTWEGQHGQKQKYRIMTGTELVIINEGQANKVQSDTNADDDDVWTYNNRVEVAIVVPADWDDHGHLRPDQPCHLTTHGKHPSIVSLTCGQSLQRRYSARRPPQPRAAGTLRLRFLIL